MIEPLRLEVSSVPIDDLAESIASSIGQGARLGLLTARLDDAMGIVLVAMSIDPRQARVRIWESPVVGDSYPSITLRVPQAHWCERAVSDLFGVRAVGHPRSKSLLLHEVWPEAFHPLASATMPVEPGAATRPKSYPFQIVKGEGVYEIPVGPIHAGIIEPGHFRFSCLGEVIQNLEIRLGYQHRGIEEQLARTPWRQARHLAEAAGSDTRVGNALAHALAIEQLLEIAPPDTAVTLRAVAMEIERIASHIGDLGGICGDIGYAGASAVFASMRGRALGLAERLSGSRFMTGFVLPGGVARGLPDETRMAIRREADAIAGAFESACDLLMDNSGALERMQGIGVVRPSLARDFGLVGPSGRASGVDYDVRRDLRQAPYRDLNCAVAVETTGDVHARVLVRVEEGRESLRLIRSLLDEQVGGPHRVKELSDALPASRYGIGIVESWRGELIHAIRTSADGGMARYHIKDPSFNNWTGLSVAARGQLVADFPLCNKSFGLSYSGNDG
jgi:Ni,Fe-hydrogenase III large subunit